MGSETLVSIHRPLASDFLFFLLSLSNFRTSFHQLHPHPQSPALSLTFFYLYQKKERKLIINGWHSTIWGGHPSPEQGGLEPSRDWAHSITVNSSVNKPYYSHPFGDVVNRDPYLPGGGAQRCESKVCHPWGSKCERMQRHIAAVVDDTTYCYLYIWFTYIFQPCS